MSTCHYILFPDALCLSQKDKDLLNLNGKEMTCKQIDEEHNICRVASHNENIPILNEYCCQYKEKCSKPSKYFFIAKLAANCGQAAIFSTTSVKAPLL